MENTASKLMRDYVNSQEFSSTSDIMEAMKDLFRDALQQVMEVELEEKLGYKKAKGHRNLTKKRCRKTTEMGILKKC